MGEWAWLALLCLLAAVLELDSASAGQFMISRPIVLGGILGLLGGEPLAGFTLGAVIELFLLAELPVGAALPMNGSVATAAAVLASLQPVQLEPAWCLPLGLLAGRLYVPLDVQLRKYRSTLAAALERRVSAGGEPGFGRALAASLSAELGLVFVFLGLAVPAIKFLGGWWWEWRPLREGATFAWKAAPALALVGAIQFMGPKGWQR